jgi:hypothetical protein
MFIISISNNDISSNKIINFKNFICFYFNNKISINFINFDLNHNN